MLSYLAIEVLDEHKGHSGVRREMGEQVGEGLQPAC
jgi:hypothetical protein